MVATILLPPEGIRTNQRPQAGIRDAKTYASSVPDHNLPVGKKGEKDSAGNLKFIGTYRGLFEVSTVMHFEERERFPKELFLPGFPTCDNLQPGTEDS